MIDKYPIGLCARNLFFGCIKSVFTDETKQFILSRMKHSAGNIKPVMVIDDETSEITCYSPNADLTGFEIDTTQNILVQKVRYGFADFYTNKTHVQKSDIENHEKTKICHSLNNKDYQKIGLIEKDKSELGKALKNTKTEFKTICSDVGITPNINDIKPEPTEQELQELGLLTSNEFNLAIQELKQKYPVYADEIEGKLERRGIKPSN